MGMDSVGIGISGLLAFQKAMATASHNITNADSVGFSRQRVELSVSDALYTGDGFVGTGTGISKISRVWDKFAQDNLNEITSSSSKYDVLNSLSDDLDTIFSNENSGLSPKIQELFVSLQSVAESPSSSSAKKQFISAADSMAQRFNSLGSMLENIESETHGMLKNITREINSYSNAISDLNNKIINASMSSDRPPNDLLDQRDRLVLSLSDKIDISTIDNNNGSINIFISNGQPLVTRSGFREIILVPSEFDNSKLETHIKDGDSSMNIYNQVSGGELGGVIHFMKKDLPGIERDLGRLAGWISGSMNNQHRAGVDENGNFGGDIFNISKSISKSSSNNTGDAILSSTFNKVSNNSLLADEYRVRKTATGWIVNNENTFDTMSSTSNAFTFEGIDIKLDSGTANVGDEFIVSPTKDALNSIRSQLTSPNLIATAYPIQTGSDKDYGVTISSGTLDYDAITASLPTIPTELRNNYDIKLNKGLARFEISLSSNPSVVLGTSAFDSNKSEQSIEFGAWSFSVSGEIPDGATFFTRTSENGSPSGDNRAILDLAAFQFENMFLNGTETIHGVYEDIVSGVGSLSHNNSINSEAQQALLTQASEKREQVSGVNLDEEAANLIKLQQAYQAAAKVIQVADKMFQVLINTI